MTKRRGMNSSTQDEALRKPDRAFFKGEVHALDTDKNRLRALKAYLEHDGSIEKTYKALEHDGFTRSLILEWEQEEEWSNHLKDMRLRITGQLITEISQRKRSDIVFLETAKHELIKGVVGEFDEDGNMTNPPLKPKSLEAACNAIIKLMQYQHELIDETTNTLTKRGDVVPIDVTTGNPINTDQPETDNALLFNVIGHVMEQEGIEGVHTTKKGNLQIKHKKTREEHEKAHPFREPDWRKKKRKHTHGAGKNKDGTREQVIDVEE